MEILKNFARIFRQLNISSLRGAKGKKLKEKLNNYCFKCLSTELLLLGGSDIFCSVCHLVFSDAETFDYLHFHRKSPVDSKYQKMGSWNWWNMIEVFYGWIQRIHLVFGVDAFYIDWKYLIHIDNEDKPLVYEEDYVVCANTNVLEKLHEQTLNDEFNKEHFDFLAGKNEDDEFKTIYFTLSASFMGKKYPVASFTVFQENYENNDLYFDSWDLLAVNWREGSYIDLKRAFEK